MNGFRLSHIWLIALYQLRFALRSGGGIVFLLLFLTTGLIVASIFITPVEGLIKMQDEQGISADTEIFLREISSSPEIQSGVRWAAGTSEEHTKYLLEEQPAVLSCIFILLLALIPYMIIIGTSNQTAGDIQNRGLRYLLLRTERINIYYGRFLGALCYTATSTLALVAFVGIYLQFKLGIYSGAEIWMWAFQGWIAILLFSIPFVALCAWMSSVVPSPFGALAINLVIVGFSTVFIFMLKSQLRATDKSEDLGWLNKLLPTGWKYDLLSDGMGARALAAFVLMGFALLFLFLGQRHFAKRDL